MCAEPRANQACRMQDQLHVRLVPPAWLPAARAHCVCCAPVHLCEKVNCGKAALCFLAGMFMMPVQ